MRVLTVFYIRCEIEYILVCFPRPFHLICIFLNLNFYLVTGTLRTIRSFTGFFSFNYIFQQPDRNRMVTLQVTKVIILSS